MTKTELIEENQKLTRKIMRKDREISELIHMHREIEKRMDDIFSNAEKQKKQTRWWMFFD